jgi:hypothetical protein
VVLWPTPTQRVMRTLTDAAPASWFMGMMATLVISFSLAALVVISGILLIVCVGLVGVLLSAALAIAFVAAGLYGWMAVGTLIGQRGLHWLKAKNVTLVASAAAGTALITFLSALPGVGWLLMLFLAPAGLGAVVLTRFGTQTPGVPAPLDTGSFESSDLAET